MAESNDNDFKIGPQGKQWRALLDTAKRLKKTDFAGLSDDDLEAIKAAASLDNLDCSTISDYLEKAIVLDNEGLLNRFVGSAYDYDQHPHYFAKLCRYQPGWCDILLQRAAGPENPEGERRMKYEMLMSIADHEEIKAALAAHFPPSDRPAGGVSFAFERDGKQTTFMKMRRNYLDWLPET